MDDPPEAHRCVQAGKMPALPGVASADRVDLPGETWNENCCLRTRIGEIFARACHSWCFAMPRAGEPAAGRTAAGGNPAPRPRRTPSRSLAKVGTGAEDMAEPALVDRPAQAAPPRRAWGSRRRSKSLRDRGKPVRRTRRVDQHHAQDSPGGGRRGHPPGAQPLGRGRSSSRRIEEDADAIAVSSYQGGHVEYFRYMVDMLRERGGVRRCRRCSAAAAGSSFPKRRATCTRTASPVSTPPRTAGTLGLRGMIDDMIARCSPRYAPRGPRAVDPEALAAR